MLFVFYFPLDIFECNLPLSRTITFWLDWLNLFLGQFFACSLLLEIKIWRIIFVSSRFYYLWTNQICHLSYKTSHDPRGLLWWDWVIALPSILLRNLLLCCRYNRTRTLLKFIVHWYLIFQPNNYNIIFKKTL